MLRPFEVTSFYLIDKNPGNDCRGFFVPDGFGTLTLRQGGLAKKTGETDTVCAVLPESPGQNHDRSMVRLSQPSPAADCCLALWGINFVAEVLR